MRQRQFVFGAVCHVDAWKPEPRVAVFREGRDQGEPDAIDALRVTNVTSISG
jgi:hypothetical protein